MGEAVLLQNREFSYQSYMDAVIGKTSALFLMPIEGSAILAGANAAEATRVSSPFVKMGALFQMQDDVLDLFGEKGRQDRGSDIKEGKISALVVQYLAINPSDRSWLLNILTKPRDETTDKMVQEVIERFRDRGALSAVLNSIKELSDQTNTAFGRVNSDKLTS